MNFNHDTGTIDTILAIDPTATPPLGGTAGVLAILGTGSLILPVGSTAQQPANAAGQIRYNNQNSNVEFNNGGGWSAFSTGGGTVSNVTLTTTTGLQVSGGTTQSISGTGTFALVLSTELQGLSGLAATGLVARTGSGTYSPRTITGTASNISVSNGDGVSGNPTIDLINAGTAITNQFVKITTDAKGRVTASTAVATADITALVDGTYINVTGDSMSSAANLTFSGGGEILGLPTVPTTAGSAASKAYVDATVQGLDPKASVRVATTAAGTLASSFENGDAIDGVTLATGDRILIKNQAAPLENGIYTVNASGAPTRAADFDSWTEVPGGYVFVEVGTANADTAWVCTADQGGTLNTTAITFVQFGGAGTYTAGTGLTLSGNSFSITSPISPTLGGTGTATAPSAVGQLLIATSGNIYTPAVLTPGTAIGVTNASGSITINNTGVTSAVAGTAISVSGATGAVTINNTGVTALAGTANQITSSGSTGSLTLSLPSAIVAPGSVAVTTALFRSIAATVSAAGSTQGTATALTASTNIVTTAAASTGVALPTAVSPFGFSVTVINRGANPVVLYPATGAQIDAAGTNVGISIPVGEEIEVVSASATQWYATETVKLTGTGISAAYGNGSTTYTNTGVTSAVAGTAISVSGSTGAVTINNTGVTSLTGTANQISVSGSTGGVTLSLPSAVTLGTSLTISGLTANSFLYSGTAGLLTTTSAPTNGQLLIGSTGAAPVAATLTNGTGISISNAAGSITINNTGVTSVGLSITGPLYTISNSPVTTTGTLTATLNTQANNAVFVGPTTGGPLAPTFRTLSLVDLTANAIKLYNENPSTPTSPVVAGTNAVGLGSGSSASATNSVASGQGAVAYLYGASARANGSFATAGDAQRGLYVLRNSTTNATITELFLDGSTSRLVMPNNSLWTFTMLVSARRTDTTGGGAGYSISGVIRKDASSASATLVGAVSKSILGETNTAWDVTVTADTTNGALRVQVTGEAAKTIRWVATVDTCEVTN